MAHKKCLICRQHTNGLCLRHGKPCAEVQDDGLCDPCGVSQNGAWEIERPKEKKKRVATEKKYVA